MKGSIQIQPGFVNCRLKFTQDGRPGSVDSSRGAARVQLLGDFGLLPERSSEDCGLYGLGLDREEADRIRQRVYKGYTQRTLFVPLDIFERFSKAVEDSELCRELVVKPGQTLPVLNLAEPRPCPDVTGADVTRDLLANAAK